MMEHPKKSDKIVNYQLTMYKHYFPKRHNIDPKIETYFACSKERKKDNVGYSSYLW